ncbi:hypothetical protein, partial [Megamonas sp.]|uniref:hypothetical protein n=1 Tax=Megamonas sp. TaxID=2049033 RepID=UPI002584BCBF
LTEFFDFCVYSTISTIFTQFQIFDFYYHKASFSASVAAVHLPYIQKKSKKLWYWYRAELFALIELLYKLLADLIFIYIFLLNTY